MKNKISFLYGLIIISGLGAIINIFQLLLIPSEPQNAFIFGLSLQRLTLFSFAFVTLIISVLLFLWLRKKQEVFIQKIENVVFNNSLLETILVLDGLIIFFSIFTYLCSFQSFDEQEVFFIRLRPTIQLIIVISLVIFIYFLSLQWKNFKIFFQSNSSSYPFFSIQNSESRFIGIFLSIGILIATASYFSLPYRQIGYWLFYDEDWVPLAVIISSIIFLISILFYTRSFIQQVSFLFPIIIFIGITININQFHHINLYSVPGMPIERLPSNQLIDLLYKDETYQVMQYPLYTLLAEYYPQSILTIDKSLIDNGIVAEKSLRRFGRTQSIESKQLDLLTDSEVKYLKFINHDKKKIIMERNMEAVSFYFILPESSQIKNQYITMRCLDEYHVFIFPSLMEEVLP
jgi:hypothetical protein